MASWVCCSAAAYWPCSSWSTSSSSGSSTRCSASRRRTLTEPRRATADRRRRRRCRPRRPGAARSSRRGRLIARCRPSRPSTHHSDESAASPSISRRRSRRRRRPADRPSSSRPDRHRCQAVGAQSNRSWLVMAILHRPTPTQFDRIELSRIDPLKYPILAYCSFIDPKRMKGWVGLVGWPVADGLPTIMVTHQLHVECRTGKVLRPETDVLPLCHATNLAICPLQAIATYILT